MHPRFRSTHSHPPTPHNTCIYTYTHSGHCVKLNPILDEIAPIVGAEHGLRIGKVDATQEGKIAKEFGVSGYGCC